MPIPKLEITIPTEPVPKARPRVVFRVINGKMKIRAYNPKRTEEAQAYLTEYLSKYIADSFPPYCPIKLKVVFYRVRSKWSPKPDTLPCRKPDLNNFLGLLLDGANKVLWSDDAQVTGCETYKRWSKKGYGYIELLLEKDIDNFETIFNKGDSL